MAAGVTTAAEAQLATTMTQARMPAMPERREVLAVTTSSWAVRPRTRPSQMSRTDPRNRSTSWTRRSAGRSGAPQLRQQVCDLLVRANAGDVAHGSVGKRARSGRHRPLQGRYRALAITRPGGAPGLQDRTRSTAGLAKNVGCGDRIVDPSAGMHG